MKLRWGLGAAVTAMSLGAALSAGCVNSDDHVAPDGGVTFEGGAGAQPDTSIEAPDAPGITPDASGDAPSDSASDAPVDAPGDAPAETDAGPPPGVYVDPVNGLDTNAGTAASPFKSIARAAQVLNAPDAGASQTVYLADGTYDATSQPNMYVTFNTPTFVRGSAPGKAIFSGTGASNEGLLFQNGGGVANMAFKNTSYGVQAHHGTFTLAGTSFDGAGKLGFPMSFINETVATVDATGVTPFLKNIPTSPSNAGCMYLDGTADVAWKAVGTLTSTSGANCVFMRGGAKLAVDGMNLQGMNGIAFVLFDRAQVSLKSSVLNNVAPQPGAVSFSQRAAIWMGGSQTGAPNSTLTLDSSSITGGAGSGISYSVIGTTTLATLTLANSHVDGNAYSGIWISGAPAANLAVQITSTGTTFDGNGISGITSVRGNVVLTGGSVSTNGAGGAVTALGQTPGGVRLTDATAVNALKMRSVALGANTGNALAFAGTAASTLDLGTAASLGASTFSGVPGGSSALSLTALVNATAIGNTWMPNVQGADATGKYLSATTLTGAASGLNVTEPSGASVVMAP